MAKTASGTASSSESPSTSVIEGGGAGIELDPYLGIKANPNSNPNPNPNGKTDPALEPEPQSNTNININTNIIDTDPDGSPVKDPAPHGQDGEDEDASQPPHKYGWRFYAIYSSLIASSLLSALDGSIVSTALPTIAETLDMGANSVWAANIYFLTG